ncbi:MAG: glycosyltransferase [Bacteroidaceae bacterium]|nr:glycosyltransferase [Bacteroidaceae bacterium]
MKKLSIITVNYNNIAGLRKTYESIQPQTFRNFEWIVVDGGSTDGGKEFIQEHQSEMSWWCSERDGGIYNGMNKGIAHAEGEYLMFLNSGDELIASDTLERVFASAPNADVIYGNWIEKKKYGFKKKCIPPKEVNYYYFAYRPLCHQTTFIRSSLLKQSPYNESYRICADWAKWVELSKAGCTFQYIPVAICLYFRDGVSYHAVKQKKEEHKRILSEFYPTDLADILYYLMMKKDERLKVIRRLVWLSSALLLMVIILSFWLCL